jgi:hypothetical protein
LWGSLAGGSDYGDLHFGGVHDIKLGWKRKKLKALGAFCYGAAQGAPDVKRSRAARCWGGSLGRCRAGSVDLRSQDLT